MTKLPSKPSELIKLAIKDLQACRADPKYEIRMICWHVPVYGKCLICLAGAVMAKTLKINPVETIDPDDFGTTTGNRLASLDYFRKGYLHWGLRDLGYTKLNQERFKRLVHVPDYETNPDAFISEMLDMANQFKKAGL